MRVGVLGSVELVRDGAPVDLGGRKQRMLVAALALHAGRPVAVDTLVDLLWGDGAPVSAVQTMHVYLAGVRRALEPDRPARTPAKILATVAPGYALRLPGGALDAADFDAAVDAVHRRLVGSAAGSPVPARPELTATELAELAARLDTALASWRGAPFLDLADAPAAVAERARLEELRLVALEDRALVRLGLGEHATVVAELEYLTAEQPLRERLWTLLVLALSATGRQADALDALRKVRRILAEELGLDPGAALRELEGAVLRQDPALFWRPTPSAPAPPAAASAESAALAAPVSGPAAVSGPVAAAVPADPRQWPLVGRRDELAALDALLAGAEAATPGFAVLVGEPGIGKTRLSEELATRAGARGFAVLAGRCSEDEGAPPMWPWVGVLRALVAAIPVDSLPEPVLADLAACVRELSPGHAAPVADGEIEVARFRLWNRVAAVLTAASAVRPLLVLLDDLHWADPSSLRLLCHLAEVLDAGRILAVVTRRPHAAPTGAQAQAAEALSRRHALRIDLVGLSTAEAAALVDAATNRTPTPHEAAALRERTEGNPFFLVELVRLVGRGGPDTAGALPTAVTEVVARRVARLPDATGRLLRVAAVIGRRFDLTLLAAASGRTEDDVLDDLDPALAAGVIAEEDTVDRFRFAHALVRDVVYAGLPAARRARQHAAVAAVLSSEPGRDGVSETARHWLMAGPANAARAWRAAALAAEQARGLYAHEEAAVLLGAAVEAQRDDPAASALDRYELAMARADACRWLGDRPGVDAALAGAVAEANRLGDVVRLARAAVGTAEGAWWQTREYGQTDEAMVGSLRRVLRELPAEDSELRCRALLVLAIELYHAYAPQYRDALVEQGMAMARRLGDPVLIVWSCQTAFLATIRASTVDNRRRLADEAVEAALELGEPMWEAVARTLRAIVAGEAGRPDILRVELRLARDIAERLRLAYLLAVLGEVEAPWLAMRGRFADVERLLHERQRLAVRLDAPNNAVAIAAFVLTQRLWQGGLVEILPAMRAVAAGSPLPVDLAIVWMLVRAGRLDDARSEYGRLTTTTLAGDDWISVQKHCQAAEIADALRMPELAAQAYAWLRPYAGRCCTAGFGFAVGPVDAFLALAARATGERAIADDHAADALRLCAEWDIPLVARWLHDRWS